MVQVSKQHKKVRFSTENIDSILGFAFISDAIDHELRVFWDFTWRDCLSLECNLPRILHQVIRYQVSCIADLPQDILFELAKQLDVANLISLATCRLIRELKFQRSLWIEAFARIKTVQMQPLPLSRADILSL
ncbi:hypothetical protein C8R44DRAFT_881355 [Mycena epipterygia]|nr:hypothetical protein C8R44DRAFT_881355 [Mycena epipterygia]